MDSTGRKALATFGVALTLGLTSCGLSRAQEGHEHQHQSGQQPKHGAPLHGGKVVMTDEYHFEVVFTKDGLSVFPRTHDDKPIDASKLTGTATFYHPNSPKPWFERKLVPSAAKRDQAAISIGSGTNLSKVPAAGAKVAFRVEGLPDPAEPTSTFTVPFAFPPSNKIAVAKATRADQDAIAAQKVCPVSNEDLFSMGGPLKVSRGDKAVFICCKGCLKKIQADPDTYLGASAAPSAHEGDRAH